MTRQNSPTLYLVLIVIVGIAAGYLYYSQVLKLAEAEIPPSPISNRDDLKTFQNLKIDFSVLDNPVYKDLTIAGEMPVRPGITGKKDIFAP